MFNRLHQLEKNMYVNFLHYSTSSASVLLAISSVDFAYFECLTSARSGVRWLTIPDICTTTPPTLCNLQALNLSDSPNPCNTDSALERHPMQPTSWDRLTAIHLDSVRLVPVIN